MNTISWAIICIHKGKTPSLLSLKLFYSCLWTTNKLLEKHVYTKLNMVYSIMR